MKMRIILVSALIIITAHPAWCADQTPIHFENNAEEWSVPDWCREQKDCVVKYISVSAEQSSNGKSSLKLSCDFPGNTWAFAIAEYEKDFDLRGYKSISADIYIPKDAPAGFFEARIIVTAGSSLWIEMRDSVALDAGKWITIKAPLEMNPSGELKYWKCASHKDCILSHLDSVRKVAIRIEYNVYEGHSGPPYKGDIYIDNVTID